MPYKAIEDIVEQHEFTQTLTVKAGEAIIFDHRLWHASTANSSETDRVVVAAIAVPNESSYVHFEKSNSGEISIYAVPDDFPLEFDVNSPLPSGSKLQDGSVSPNEEITEKEFRRIYHTFNPPAVKQPFWKKLFSNIMSSN